MPHLSWFSIVVVLAWSPGRPLVVCFLAWCPGCLAVVCFLAWRPGCLAVVCFLAWSPGWLAVVCFLNWLSGCLFIIGYSTRLPGSLLVSLRRGGWLRLVVNLELFVLLTRAWHHALNQSFKKYMYNLPTWTFAPDFRIS